MKPAVPRAVRRSSDVLLGPASRQPRPGTPARWPGDRAGTARLSASSTVAVPVLGYLAGTGWPRRWTRLRAWLTQNNAAVMAVLLLVIGTVLLGKGVAGF